MKTKKINSKLSFQKVTVSNLSTNELNTVKGGLEPTDSSCLYTQIYKICTVNTFQTCTV
jgi:natural product precursor